MPTGACPFPSFVYTSGVNFEDPLAPAVDRLYGLCRRDAGSMADMAEKHTCRKMRKTMGRFTGLYMVYIYI